VTSRKPSAYLRKRDADLRRALIATVSGQLRQVRRLDIVVWLRILGLGRYEASFRENVKVNAT
jgi:hypothetical protein